MVHNATEARLLFIRYLFGCQANGRLSKVAPIQTFFSEANAIERQLDGHHPMIE